MPQFEIKVHVAYGRRERVETLKIYARDREAAEQEALTIVRDYYPQATSLRITDKELA